MRVFFMEKDALEVETPIRMPAPAPEAHIDAEASDNWFLHTSPELCMKRLLAAGYPRIFQICRCFRQKERGRRHLPEFTLLEWYWAGMDYFEMMNQCEEMIRFVSRRLGFGDHLVYQEETINLDYPWPRMTVKEAFDLFASMSMAEALAQDRFDEVLACEIEPHLGRGTPLFVYDYPSAHSALARLKPEDPTVAERFELYIGGLELCNAFTELVDAEEQRIRFAAEQNHRRLSGKAVYPMPERFLQSLCHMPEASGNALGIDRLVMLFADTAQIDDVVAFTPEEL
jgi:lysyl-tRNA synthetase class 2